MERVILLPWSARLMELEPQRIDCGAPKRLTFRPMTPKQAIAGIDVAIATKRVNVFSEVAMSQSVERRAELGSVFRASSYCDLHPTMWLLSRTRLQIWGSSGCFEQTSSSHTSCLESMITEGKLVCI